MKASSPPLVHPLIMLFGSYRGNGKDTLCSFSKFLQAEKYNACIVEDYDIGIPHSLGLDASFACVDACDIAIFVFFNGETIGVDAHLECFDQGPIIEFAYLCLCKKERTDVQFVFETDARGKESSSLLHQLTKKSPTLGRMKEPIKYPRINGDSAEERLAAMRHAILTFCEIRYQERGIH